MVSLSEAPQAARIEDLCRFSIADLEKTITGRSPLKHSLEKGASTASFCHSLDSSSSRGKVLMLPEGQTRDGGIKPHCIVDQNHLAPTETK